MVRPESQTRQFDFQTRSAEEGQELWVEGYAVVFNRETVLFEMDGNEYKEEISPDAFADTRMDDVIFNYNHQGKVMARTRNHTLTLSVDDKGLFIRARLDGTQEGRELYEEIQGGYVDRMSFQFTVAEESYDREARKWTIRRVKRLYDVSAVSIPAYDDTSISARRDAALEADAQARRVEVAEAALARARVEIKLKLS
jgi:HK97 family phage prohead protease|nr:MAG TPA: prohead serine protease [Caudoviricetes sp.]